MKPSPGGIWLQSLNAGGTEIDLALKTTFNGRDHTQRIPVPFLGNAWRHDVGNSVESLTVTAPAKEAGDTVAITAIQPDGTKPRITHTEDTDDYAVPLAVGVNAVLIKVTRSGENREYMLTIDRAASDGTNTTYWDETDRIAPTPQIEPKIADDLGTMISPVAEPFHISIYFNQYFGPDWPVFLFGMADIKVENATLSEFTDEAECDCFRYTVTPTGMVLVKVTLSIPANVLYDRSGNANFASKTVSIYYKPEEPQEPN